MARDELEGQEGEHSARRPVENAPLAAPGLVPSRDEAEEHTAADQIHSGLEDLEEIAQPRDPSVLRPEGATDAESSWEEPPTAAAPKAQFRYSPPPSKRGRKPDPSSPRALRTYEEWKLRASAGTAEDRAAARSFGLAVMEAMRSRGEHLKADELGRREGFLVEAAPAAPATPASGGSAPTGAPEAQAPAAQGAAASTGPTVAAAASSAPPPRGPRIYGQPVERVKAALHSVSPGVDVLAGLASRWGVDLTQPTKRTFFKGKPGLEEQIEISPRERLAELMAAKLCARAEEATLVGEDSDEDENTDLELLMLLGTTLGPVAVAVGKKVLSTCVTGATALFQLVRRRR